MITKSTRNVTGADESGPWASRSDWRRPYVRGTFSHATTVLWILIAIILFGGVLTCPKKQEPREQPALPRVVKFR